MKKIAILTITNSGMNFGNRLQNYALQCILESFSIEVSTIFSAKQIYNSLFLSKVRRFSKVILKRSSRRRCFNDFDKKYIKKAKRIHYEHINDHSFADEYDAFIAGSDQVWNPFFVFNSGFEFADFVLPNKRYSYAASFGVNEIPINRRTEYADRLKNMNRISVRETRAAEIVRELTGRYAEVHVDPTMLLDTAQYIKIEERPPHILPEKYLLMYLLGEQKREYVEFIIETAERLNVQVIELSELKDTPFCNIGPQHFLYLIRHAEYLCTDSFHGTIFAILFQIPFTVFYRSGYDYNAPMGSRIDTLLEKFRLDNRKFGNLDVERSLVNIPFDEVGRRLCNERETAIKYLREIVESC